MTASDRYGRAIDAVSELLSKLKLDWMFVGSVARVAWLGGAVDSGSIEVVALMQPQQKSQVAMMASHHGFQVNREEIDRSEELDLIPLHFAGVRIHVLVASNALYARMIRAARSTAVAERELRVAAPEDLALLLTLSEDFEGVQRLMAHGDFDRARYNDTLSSIGLRGLVR